MDKTPSSDGACCLPNAEGVTYLRVAPQSQEPTLLVALDLDPLGDTG